MSFVLKFQVFSFLRRSVRLALFGPTAGRRRLSPGCPVDTSCEWQRSAGGLLWPEDVIFVFLTFSVEPLTAAVFVRKENITHRAHKGINETKKRQ